MSRKYQAKVTIIVILVVSLMIGIPVFFYGTETGIEIRNERFSSLRVADDNTDYETVRMVENTCRSMIASYTSDKMMYESYIQSDDTKKAEWAEQARMRANNTASIYNNYILKNQYVFQNNVPDDIYSELEYLD